MNDEFVDLPKECVTDEFVDLPEECVTDEFVGFTGTTPRPVPQRPDDPTTESECDYPTTVSSRTNHRPSSR